MCEGGALSHWNEEHVFPKKHMDSLSVGMPVMLTHSSLGGVITKLYPRNDTVCVQLSKMEDIVLPASEVVHIKGKRFVDGFLNGLMGVYAIAKHRSK